MTNSDLLPKLEPPDAYVSVFDPVREPAFRPSKFKPLPSWMNSLQNNVHRGKERRSDAVLEHPYLYLPELCRSIENRDSDSSENSTDFGRSPKDLVDIPSLRGGGRVTSSMNSAVKSRKQTKYGADDTDDSESIPCPRSVQTSDPPSTTPLEHPSYHLPPPRRQTPYPQHLPCRSSSRTEDNAYFLQSTSFGLAKGPASEPCCELGSQLQRKYIQEGKLLPKISDRGASSQGFSLAALYSSEYLDKYLDIYLPKGRGADKNKNISARGESLVDKNEGTKLGRRDNAKGIKEARRIREPREK
jgi:hypothetical protein